MSYRLNWFGEECERQIRAAVLAWLHAATRTVEARAKKLLGRAGTSKRKGQARAYGAIRSKPGEPPRKQYGTLRASVASEVDEVREVGRVGTNLPYGKHLELGTRKIAPRPWLRRAHIESRSELLRLIGTIKGRFF